MKLAILKPEIKEWAKEVEEQDCSYSYETLLDISSQLLNHCQLKELKPFFAWLNAEGWVPYDSLERWLNQRKGNKVYTIKTLYSIFKEKIK